MPLDTITNVTLEIEETLALTRLPSGAPVTNHVAIGLHTLVHYHRTVRGGAEVKGWHDDKLQEVAKLAKHHRATSYQLEEPSEWRNNMAIYSLQLYR